MAKNNTQPLTHQPGLKLAATIADGWRCSYVDRDRLMLVHPDHEPRVVALASIKEGDILPRPDDEALGFPPALGGR